MLQLAAAFLLGATVAVVAALPAAFALVLVVRFALRREIAATTDRDQWRSAAANAAVAARVAEMGTEDGDEDYTGG